MKIIVNYSNILICTKKVDLSESFLYILDTGFTIYFIIYLWFDHAKLLLYDISKNKC